MTRLWPSDPFMKHNKLKKEQEHGLTPVYDLHPLHASQALLTATSHFYHNSCLSPLTPAVATLLSEPISGEPLYLISSLSVPIWSDKFGCDSKQKTREKKSAWNLLAFEQNIWSSHLPFPG